MSFFLNGLFCHLRLLNWLNKLQDGGILLYRLGSLGRLCSLHSLGSLNGFLRLHGVVKLHTFVQHHRLELRERLVDQLLHRRIRGEGYFLVTFYHHTLARVHVDTLTRLNVDDLEGAQPLDFHQTVGSQPVLHHLKDGVGKAVGILLLQFALGCQYGSYLQY